MILSQNRILMTIVALAIPCINYAGEAAKLQQNRPVIAITQLVSHTSLDKVRKGIMDELTDQGYHDGQNATILFQNAQGNIVNTVQIAQYFVSMHPSAMVAIATPSAQALVNTAKNTQIPIVFASITDPVQSKLVSDLKHPNGNSTGTRNVTPVDKQLKLIKTIIPAAKTIGIILNYGDTNSVNLLKNVIAHAPTMGLAIKPIGIASSADVQSATGSLIGQVDAILLLQDNTVASALPALINVTKKNNLPVFSFFIDAVEKGALAGIACDEYKLGRQTGKMLVKILHGANPSTLPVEDPVQVELALNVETAKQLHIQYSPQILKNANRIYPSNQTRD